MSFEKKYTPVLSTEEMSNLLNKGPVSLSSEQIQTLKAVIENETSSEAEKTKAKMLLVLHSLNKDNYASKKSQNDQQSTVPVNTREGGATKKRKRTVSESNSEANLNASPSDSSSEKEDDSDSSRSDKEENKSRKFIFFPPHKVSTARTTVTFGASKIETNEPTAVQSTVKTDGKTTQTNKITNASTIQIEKQNFNFIAKSENNDIEFEANSSHSPNGKR